MLGEGEGGGGGEFEVLFVFVSYLFTVLEGKGWQRRRGGKGGREGEHTRVELSTVDRRGKSLIP